MKRIGLFLLALTLLVGANAVASTIDMDSLKDEIVKTSKEIQDQKKDSIIMSKLSPNQLLELKKGEQEVEKQKIEAERHAEMPLPSFIIFLICALPFLFVGTIIVVNVRHKNMESKRKYELYTKSLEMGQTIPENFFDEPKKANPASNLKRGVIWLAVGLAVLISFVIMQKHNGLILGIVPAFVGVGYLIVHFLDKPKSDSSAE
ncbi:MAG: DUF6249 domain-containing protein [Paludibacter sp.]